MAYRIRSMDTLRSVAILIVMLAHSVLGYGAPHEIAPLQLGGIGVDLFFVLSGWLLGGQLFKEMNGGVIDVRRFWVRRWMRTLPAYYIILSLTIFEQAVTKAHPYLRWDYYLFFQNYNRPIDIFYVSWSLAVEEHFYLFIAPFIAFLAPFSKNKRLAFLLVLLAIPSVFRHFGLYGDLVETHVRVDGCIAGVILAFLYYQYSSIWDFLSKYSLIIFVISIIFFVIFFVQRWVPMSWIHNPTILDLALLFGAWVLFANSSESIRKKFYFPGAYYIATRSYSLYLLHPEAIAILNRLNFHPPFVIYYFFVLIISALFAECLYRFVELPFMSMRSKFKVSRAPVVSTLDIKR